jgi:small subunit ribosomal protein S11
MMKKLFFSTFANHNIGKHYLHKNPQYLEKVSEALDEVLKTTEKVREWTRTNKRTNGSMLPHEFKEYIPPDVAVIHLKASRNNTHCVVMDNKHNTVTHCSAGMVGLRGSETGSAEGGTRTGTEIAKRCKAKGINNIFINFKGFGQGRDPCFRSIMASLNILRISDKTPLPHGGCRPKKRRRV